MLNSYTVGLHIYRQSCVVHRTYAACSVIGLRFHHILRHVFGLAVQHREQSTECGARITEQHSTARRGTARHGMAQHDSAQYSVSTTQYCTVQHCTAWHGM